MIVDVDEARRDDQARGRRRRCRPVFGVAGADGDDAIAFDADVRTPQRGAGAIGDVGADDRPRFGRRALPAPTHASAAEATSERGESVRNEWSRVRAVQMQPRKHEEHESYTKKTASLKTMQPRKPEEHDASRSR